MLDKIKGGIYGVAVGDALGATVEFMSKEEIKAQYGLHKDIIGGGWLELAPGEYTDDTQMTLAVAKGIINNPRNPIQEIGEYFIKWYETKPRDIGITTRLALQNYQEIGNWREAARLTREQLEGRTAGNGSIMRTLPISFAYFNNYQLMDTISQHVAAMTHLDIESEAACIFYNRYAANLINCKDKMTCFDKVIFDLKKLLESPGLETLFGKLNDAKSLRIDSLKASGYIIDTLIAALTMFLKFDRFEDILIQTVNLGDDADTAGAVAGGLAGTYYGFEGIPQRWLESIQNKDVLDEIISDLYDISQKQEKVGKMFI